MEQVLCGADAQSGRDGQAHPAVRKEREGWIKCVSDNEKYAPFDVPMEDIVSVALVNGSISLE